MAHRRLVRSLVLVAALAAGCTGDIRTDDDRSTGLASCGAPEDPVAAFWGSDEGAGFPDDATSGTPPGGDIWAMTTDGAVRRVTDDARSRDPSISDDAQRVYFTRNDGGFSAGAVSLGTTLWVHDLRSGDESMLFDAGISGSFQGIEESPDGSAVAFVALVGGAQHARSQLYVLALSGGAEPEAVEVSTGSRGSSYEVPNSPTWSPDGKRLAYVLLEDGSGANLQPSVRVVDLTTGVDEQLYDPTAGGTYLTDLHWSPDGRSVLATQSGGNGPRRGALAASIDIETGERRVLADTGAERPTLASADAAAVATIGRTFEQYDNPELPQESMFRRWTHDEVQETGLSAHLSFATQLTVADCALP